ncbi:MAG: transglycosylase SLT domain-containing protein [Deltaproteobacteria bacterium]|nr:transglycosylase SLT domain-containing protein [Deltaproteobacteria bacterium]
MEYLARAALALRRYAEAVTLFQQLLAAPPSPDARGALELHLARTLAGAGDVAAARRHFEGARQGLPEIPEYVLWLELQALGQARDEPGFQAVSAALTALRPPQFLLARARFEEAELARRLGQPARARALWEELLASPGQREFQPADLHGRIARSLEETGDLPGAAARYLLIVERYPATREALDAAQKVEGLAPPPLSPEQRLRLATVYFTHGQYARARQHLDALDEAPAGNGALEAQALVLRIRMFQREGDVEAAAALAQRLVTRFPQAPQAPRALFQLGLAELRRNRFAEARAYLARVAREYAAHTLADDALYLVAESYHEVEHPSHRALREARRGYREVVRRHPQGDLAPQALLRLGHLWLREGRYGRAASTFAELRAGYPQHELALAGLYWEARTREQEGKTALARQIYRQAMSARPFAYYALAAAARLGERPGEAADRPEPPGAVDTPSVPPGAPAPAPGAPAASPVPGANVTTPDAPLTGADPLSRQKKVERLLALGMREEAGREVEELLGSLASQRPALIAALDALERWGFYDRMVATAQLLSLGRNASGLRPRLFPLAYAGLVMTEADEHGADPWLLLAMMRQESLFNPQAVSRTGALGLLQLMPATAEQVVRAQPGLGEVPRRLLMSPEPNLHLATLYLQELRRQFPALEHAVAAYNAGPHQVARWLRWYGDLEPNAFVEWIPFRETRQYVKEVLRNYWIYQQLWGRRVGGPPAGKREGS